jgi:exopolysaccharide production protein ExoQ
MHSFDLSRARSFTPMIDKWSIFPISAVVYVSIVAPLISQEQTIQSIVAGESEWHNRVFWPVVAASSVGLAVLNRSCVGKRSLPPNIICLLVYLAFAGASVLWSFKPEISFIRFTQQAMILTSVILPAMLAVRTADVMRGLFLCFAFGSILNVLFLPGSEHFDYMGLSLGLRGYLSGKNVLGQFAAIAFLLALHEMLRRGLRRALGVIIAVIAIMLLWLSQSKTSLAFAISAPFLAGLTLFAGKRMCISPAIILFSIAFCCAVLSKLSGVNTHRLSEILYGDSTFTGRTLIWYFASWEIDRRPLLGWGYQSFWLVGPDGPSVVEGPDWVKNMPHAHNGYYDTMLDMGYVGLTLLVIFIAATLHGIGRIADRDPARAWLMLSLVIFTIFYNFLETTWMHGGDLLWVVFTVVAAETGRCWRLYQPIRVTYGLRSSRPANPGLSRGLRARGAPTHISEPHRSVSGSPDLDR